MALTSARRRPALWLIATLVFTPGVFAHAHLEHQYPAAHAAVEAAPQALTLNFSEGIEALFSGLTLATRPLKRVKQNVMRRIKSSSSFR